MKLYKYLGPDVLNLALSTKGECQFKCSYPKDFNDPYELFLTVDFQQDPDLLATYRDTIGELPQLPTTCFSKSPIVIPMWAHYANGHRGVVVEIDEEILQQKMPDVSLGDVDYCEGPSDGLLDLLVRASRIKKARYHFLLHQGVFSSAYFSKLKCWSYEEEKRLIANEDIVKKVNNNIFIGLPLECVTAIISGNNASEESKIQVRELASNIGAKYLEIKIGKSTTAPYFIDSTHSTYIYKSGAIVASDNSCEKCSEPTSGKYSLCPWCAVTDDHEENAARSNPLRIYEQYGMLDDYYEGMMEIGRKHRKKE